MKHLTTVWKDKEKTEIKAYALTISVPVGERAQAVSDALVAELGDETSYKKSEFVCDCIVSGVMEPVAQERIGHALKIIDDDLNDPETILDYIEPILAVVKMALLGCPTNVTTEFTGELSSEYIERYGDE